MESKASWIKVLAGPTVFAAIIIAGAFLLPWRTIQWGSLIFSQPETITVIGEATASERSQRATFTAGVSSVSDNKEQAINEVNSKVQAIIDAVKEFGVESEDIQTQNISVYQSEETYYDEQGRQKARPGQWRVNNNIEIVLRDVDRAQALTDLLSQSGATNVYGPNFSLEEEIKNEEELLEKAVQNAKDKAEAVAAAQGKKLGEIITISEEGVRGVITPFLRGDGLGGGGAPVEPGTQTVGKTVTVTFALE